MIPHSRSGLWESAEQADTLRLSVEKYRSRAVAYEKDQQLYKAFFMWHVVQKIVPDDQQAGQKVVDLEQRIHCGVNQHFLKGVNYARRKSYLSARNEYLMMLAYDPNQKEALELLRDESTLPGYMIYETKTGDTFRKVAKKVYLDPGKDFIVAYFSGLSDESYLRPGMVLKLPVIGPESELKPRRITQPGMSRMRRFINRARVENYYRRGVSYFLADDMQGAIREWEKTLSIDQGHSNARRNIEKARKLLRKRQLQ